MNIAIDGRLIESTHKTGVERYAEYITNALVSIDGENEYVFLFNSLRRKYPNIAIPAQKNFTFHVAKIPSIFRENVFNRLWYDHYLPYKLNRLGCNIFHGLDFGVPKTANMGLVVTIHDLQAFVSPEFMSEQGSALYKQMTATSIERAHRVIVPSRYVQKGIAQYIPHFAHKVRVIHHGVDTGMFYEINERAQVDSFKRMYGLPDEYMIFAGAINERKNILNLLKGFNMFKNNTHSPLKLVLAGGKAMGYEDVTSFIADSGLRDEVILFGYATHEQLRFLYNGARFLTFPSCEESFGLPLLEAMACGIPVLTSNYSALPEIAGDAGLLVDHRNPASISEGITTLVHNNDIYHRLKSNCNAVVKKYSWAAAAGKTIEVYREAYNEFGLSTQRT